MPPVQHQAKKQQQQISPQPGQNAASQAWSFTINGLKSVSQQASPAPATTLVKKAPWPFETGEDESKPSPSRPPGRRALVRGLILRINPAVKSYLEDLAALDNSFNAVLKPESKIRESREYFIAGKVFYLPPETPDRIRKKLPEGADITVKTTIPPARITSDTLRFDELRMSIRYDPETGPQIDLDDPRTPCEIAGTFEFAAKAHAAVLTSCGEVAPSPCENCSCSQKEPRKPSIS